MSLTLPKARKGCSIGQVDPVEYHAQKSHFTVSKSMLTEFAESPFKFKYNRDRGIKKTSSGFEFGNLVDCLALTPERFDSLYHVVEVKPRSNSNAYSELLKEAGDRTIITREEHGNALEATVNLNEHLKEEWGLVLGKTFVSQVAWKCRLKKLHGISLEATGLLDILPVTTMERTLVDVKTAGKNIGDWRRLQYDFFDYGYHTQGAMYQDGMNMAIGEDLYDEFVFVCVESVAPFRVKSVVMSREDYEIGSETWKNLTYRYASCMATDIWPGKELRREHGIVPPQKIKAWEMEGNI